MERQAGFAYFMASIVTYRVVCSDRAVYPVSECDLRNRSEDGVCWSAAWEISRFVYTAVYAVATVCIRNMRMGRVENI